MRNTNQRRSRSNRTNGKRPYSNGQNRSFESNGPSAKLRGTAAQVFDKYLALARDASSSGDRISAENFFQHAEHYYRIHTSFTAEKKTKDAEKSSENSSLTENTKEHDDLEKNGQSQITEEFSEAAEKSVSKKSLEKKKEVSKKKLDKRKTNGSEPNNETLAETE
tara:strand:+ start:985 stop:1479 length:495 start_codon:yes stop_codon:yes gene_type:complete